MSLRVTSLRCFIGMGQYVIINIDFHETARQTLQSAKACLQKLVKMISLLCLTYSLKAGRQDVSTTFCTVLCIPVLKGVANSNREEKSRGACCWYPESLWQWYCISSSPAGWARNVLRPNSVSSFHTSSFFALQGYYLDRFWELLLFFWDLWVCGVLMPGEISLPAISTV